MESISSPSPQTSESVAQSVAAILKRAAIAYLNSAPTLQWPDGFSADAIEVELQVPRDAKHGDWATNIAMKLAKPLRSKPIDIAKGIVEKIEPNNLIEPPEVVAPGFINLRVGAEAIRRTIDTILTEKENFGKTNTHAGKGVLVEFVSANPTGPLHVGHGRNAVVGDTLARIYQAVGYSVEREYYFNDAGVQMEKLGLSLRARYLQLCERNFEMPEGGYCGEYVLEIADKLIREYGESIAEQKDVPFFIRYASDPIIASIREDLALLGIYFDSYFSESSLYREGRVEAVLKKLKELGQVYENEGALWLRSSNYGDEKDRVVRKSDGTVTYLTPDIAYHENKLARGYDMLVNVLGADHHSYIVRLKAAIEALGYDPKKLHTVLIQMVSVTQGGEVKKFSKRAGDYVTLREVVDELGADLTRFFFLLRAADSQMVVDIDFAKQQSKDNPYWYIQYVHARCCSLLLKAAEKSIAWEGMQSSHIALLSAPEERAIIFQMGRLPAVVAESASLDEPLPLLNYLRDLATSFHSYYSAGDKDENLRVVRPDQPEITQARLTLIHSLRQTIANGLRILGLTPIERL